MAAGGAARRRGAFVNRPSFAVVGHPNKGKSSLVATLARDLTVRISPDPGTTREARAFPMQLAGETLYTLVDTPGFQRARAALDWMRRQESDAASRPRVVARFVEAHRGEAHFHDEVELLQPILDGAGIIYVVDGAAPYGSEYDAEMEILRWTGRPSLAVINPIGQPRHVEAWRDALGQFFRVVRVLDVLAAPFAQQIELLQAFGHLHEDWREPVERAVAALRDHREQQREDAARVVAELIAAAVTHEETRDIARDDDAEKAARELDAAYRSRLRRLEQRARQAIEAVYGHEGIDRDEPALEMLEADLLSRESWLAFGLRPRDLVALGAVGGAVAGGAVDAALLGHSFLAGTVLGGIAGGALGYFSSHKLAEVKVLRHPLGGVRLRCGPTRNLQFPFVLLGRALLHHAVIAGRTHARRDRVQIATPGRPFVLADAEKRDLARLFERIRRSDAASGSRSAAVDYLAEAVARLMEERDQA